MSEVDHLVAALFAMARAPNTPTREELLEEYDYFVRVLPARREAARLAESERGMEAWRKT